jgi:hypothetical protein
MNNTLVIYCYFEKNDDYKNNLIYFLNFGLEEYNDYIFVINGQCTLKIPKQNNIKVLHRDNIGYDFSAYGHAIKLIDIEQYKYFFFINTSVRGPFLPDYVKMSWTDPFKNLLKDDVKLVGTTINLTEDFLSSNNNKHYYGEKKYYIHVQSQMFATDLECLKFLISKGIFDLFTENNFSKIIILREIGMSQHILKNNWNISCVLPEYQNIDYRTLNVDFNPTSHKGEMNLKKLYFTRTLHPYEAIFIKTNRDLLNNYMQSISMYNLNQKSSTIIFIFYYNNEDITTYINYKYIYLVRINDYFDIFYFLANNKFLWINKENIGILLFNEITNINFVNNIVNNIDNNKLVIINTKKHYNYDNNVLIKYLNQLNLNKSKINDFTSFITKKKYFIDFMKIYETFLINKKDNVLLIKILTSYFSNLNIKIDTISINKNNNNNNKIIIIVIIIFITIIIIQINIYYKQYIIF